MKHLFALTAASMLLGLVACDDLIITDDPTDVTETGWCDVDTMFPENGALSAVDYVDESNGLACQTYDGDVTISYFPAPTCAGDKWSYKLEAKGWTSGGRLTVFDAAGGAEDQSWWWGEQHDWVDGASHDGGWWDELKQDLPTVANSNDFVANTNTFHSCAANDGKTLTWAYEVFDYDDQTKRIDCIIVGAYTSQLLVKYPGLDGCEIINGFTQ